jgi:PPOX class probable F420-dependent enzyme
MTEKEARRRVATARVGRLATISADGRPHVVPICFALVGDRVVSVVDHKAKRTLELRRLDNVRRNPAVQLVVDHYDDDWTALWWVRVSGDARVVDDWEERDDAISLLAEKYPQYRQDRPAGAVLALHVTGISSWEASPG